MNEKNELPFNKKISCVVSILTGIVVLLMLCVCVILILLLIYGWQIIYVL
jgi:tetrahydromethanopterin S-methyltransferase subunit G